MIHRDDHQRKIHLQRKLKLPKKFRAETHLVIAPSTIQDAGIGVFAATDIEAEEVVTSYKGKIRKTNPMECGGTYSLELDDSHTIVGNPKHRRIGACGQLVNDRACVLLRDWLSEDSWEDSVMNYAASMSLCNCFLCRDRDSVVPYLVLRLPVKTGDELFLHYGLDYWMYSAMHDADATPIIVETLQRRRDSQVYLNALKAETTAEMLITEV